MSTGTRNKNLLVIIAVLFLTNIAVLGYFLWYKKPHREQYSNNRDRNVVGDMLKKDVGFDTVQITSYREMRQKQQDVLRPMFDDMRRSKDSLFSLIGKAPADDSLVQHRAGTAFAGRKNSGRFAGQGLFAFHQSAQPDAAPGYHQRAPSQLN